MSTSAAVPPELVRVILTLGLGAATAGLMSGFATASALVKVTDVRGLR